MVNLSVKCLINHQEVGVSELAAIEFERTKHVLHEMKSLGALVQYKGQVISQSAINLLSVSEAHAINIATREQYSATEIQTMYQNQIRSMENLWRHVDADFNLQTSDFKVSQAEMTVIGVDPDLIINGRPQKSMANESPSEKMKRIADEASEMALRMNPEHFFVTSSSQGLYGMETFGMYGAPYPQLITPMSTDALPISRDSEYPIATTGQPTLMDGTPLYTIPFHQYQPLPNGIKMKLSVIMPQKTPDEIIKGHAYHLAIEFLHTAEMYAE